MTWPRSSTRAASPDAAQEFTSNKRLLLNAVDKFMGEKLRSSTMNRIDEEAQDARTAPIRRHDRRSRHRRARLQARNTLDSLKNFADIMAGVRGRRKALVYFSEGIDYDINDPFNNRDATTLIDAHARPDRRRDAGERRHLWHRRPRPWCRGRRRHRDSVVSRRSDARPDQQRPATTRCGLGRTACASSPTRPAASPRSTTTTSPARSTAWSRRTARTTCLATTPANDRRDGRFRKIEVRVNKPGLTVRARRGYFAPRGRAPEPSSPVPNDASAELREAMSSPVPVAGLPLAATASVFKGPDNKGSVVVSTLIGGRDLPLSRRTARSATISRSPVLAIDAKGQVVPGRAQHGEPHAQARLGGADSRRRLPCHLLAGSAARALSVARRRARSQHTTRRARAVRPRGPGLRRRRRSR